MIDTDGIETQIDGLIGKFHIVSSVLRNLPSLERDGFGDSDNGYYGLGCIVEEGAVKLAEIKEALGIKGGDNVSKEAEMKEGGPRVRTLDIKDLLDNKLTPQIEKLRLVRELALDGNDLIGGGL